MSLESVAHLKSLLTDQPDHCLRPAQRMELEQEAERLGSVVNAPDWQAGPAKAQARERYGKVRQMLKTQAPKPIDQPMRKDEVHRLAKEVLDDVIKPAMLTRAEMRRNPAGAVSQFLRRENSPAVQDAIRAWKRAQFALDPQTDDEDHANIEKHRQEGLPLAGVSTFMTDAQIAGNFAFSPQAKANWPADMPLQGTVNSPLAQATQREKRPASPKMLAALALGRQRKADKQAAARAAANVVTPEPTPLVATEG